MAQPETIFHRKVSFRGGVSLHGPNGSTELDDSGTGIVLKETYTAPALGTTTAVHAAVTDNGAPQTITAAITNPDVPRVISATAGGTGADIKAIQVVIAGTDIDDQAITETLPAFTVNTPGTVTGTKAFKTVTSITIPAHDGTGATTAIGVGAALGLSRTGTMDTCLMAFLGTTREGTLPTVLRSSTVLSSNTMALSSALDGSDVTAYFAVE